ncbi:carboxypeptidase cpds [Moniliophthora roreri]|nr:carboxypeptidase cpds [Moniliophthora roreri]
MKRARRVIDSLASTSLTASLQLFFWFFPPGPKGSLDDIIFWTNGGPGCSSLEGFLQGNGPFSWSVGTAKPVVNGYSWTNLSSVLWVEQPVGTGFTQGVANIRVCLSYFRYANPSEVERQNGDDLAEQLVGFFNEFLKIFPELKGKNLYLTGESYAGVYIPYIANWIYEHPDKLPDWHLKGTWMGDLNDQLLLAALIGDQTRDYQTTVPTFTFLQKYENVFSLNQSYMNTIRQIDQDCGLTEYLNKYLAAPPAGPIPLHPRVRDDICGNIWNNITEAVLLVNPAFNLYRANKNRTRSGSFDNIQTSPLYFDRKDVKRAIHAPLNVTWKECAGHEHVFPHGDASETVAWRVLPNVIEKSKRTVIAHGLADFFYMAEGTRLVIQNLREQMNSRCSYPGNGKQGFQTNIKTDSFIVEGMGALGRTITERGLTYVEIALSGHEIPQFSPKAAFQTMQYLMGFRDNVSL